MPAPSDPPREPSALRPQPTAGDADLNLAAMHEMVAAWRADLCRRLRWEIRILAAALILVGVPLLVWWLGPLKVPGSEFFLLGIPLGALFVVLCVVMVLAVRLGGAMNEFMERVDLRMADAALTLPEPRPGEVLCGVVCSAIGPDRMLLRPRVPLWWSVAFRVVAGALGAYGAAMVLRSAWMGFAEGGMSGALHGASRYWEFLLFFVIALLPLLRSFAIERDTVGVRLTCISGPLLIGYRCLGERLGHSRCSISRPISKLLIRQIEIDFAAYGTTTQREIGMLWFMHLPRARIDAERLRRAISARLRPRALLGDIGAER